MKVVALLLIALCACAVASEVADVEEVAEVAEAEEAELIGTEEEVEEEESEEEGWGRRRRRRRSARRRSGKISLKNGGINYGTDNSDITYGYDIPTNTHSLSGSWSFEEMSEEEAEVTEEEVAAWEALKGTMTVDERGESEEENMQIRETEGEFVSEKVTDEYIFAAYGCCTTNLLFYAFGNDTADCKNQPWIYTSFLDVRPKRSWNGKQIHAACLQHDLCLTTCKGDGNYGYSNYRNGGQCDALFRYAKLKAWKFKFVRTTVIKTAILGGRPNKKFKCTRPKSSRYIAFDYSRRRRRRRYVDNTRRRRRRTDNSRRRASAQTNKYSRG